MKSACLFKSAIQMSAKTYADTTATVGSGPTAGLDQAIRKYVVVFFPDSLVKLVCVWGTNIVVPCIHPLGMQSQ